MTDPKPWTRAQFKRGVRVQDLPSVIHSHFHFDVVGLYETPEGLRFYVDAPPALCPEVLDVPRQSPPTP